MIPDLNMLAGWLGLLMTVVSGIYMGLHFHKDNWLGGYAAWPRRMVRLGHISFFGLGVVNLLFAMWLPSMLAVTHDFSIGSWVGGWLLLAGLVTMPTVCFCSARWAGFRRLFFIPVLSTLLGIVTVLLVMMKVIP